MSYSVKGTNITMTRGDTFSADICIYQPNGKPYNLVEGDVVQFAMKKIGKRCKYPYFKRHTNRYNEIGIKSG